MTSDVGVAKPTKMTQVQREFKGFFDCCMQISRNDSRFKAYRGFWIALPGQSLYMGLHYELYAIACGLYNLHNGCFCPNCEKKESSFLTQCSVATVTNILASIPTYPFETIR